MFRRRSPSLLLLAGSIALLGAPWPLVAANAAGDEATAASVEPLVLDFGFRRATADGRLEERQPDAARQALLEEVAAGDPRFARELGEFRRLLAALASSPVAGKREALATYLAGRRMAGYERLRQLVQADPAAGATGWREVAALGLDLHSREELGPERVIEDLREVQRRDPGGVWSWLELQRLLAQAGDLAAELEVTEKVVALLSGDRERAMALVDLGDVQLDLEDVAKAKASFEQAVRLGEKSIAAGGAGTTQRELGIALSRLGAALEESGDLAGARLRYERALTIDEEQARRRPASVVAQRDLAIGLGDLGGVLAASGDLAGGRQHLERSQAIFERLAERDPSDAAAQRDASVGLTTLGDLLAEAGDLPGALHAFERALAIDERLAKLDPASVQAQRDLSVSLSDLADLLVESGDLANARRRYERALQIDQELAARNPQGARERYHLALAHMKLYEVSPDAAHLAAALRLAEALEAEGRLPPDDPTLLEDLRALAGAQPKP